MSEKLYQPFTLPFGGLRNFISHHEKHGWKGKKRKEIFFFFNLKVQIYIFHLISLQRCKKWTLLPWNIQQENKQTLLQICHIIIIILCLFVLHTSLILLVILFIYFSMIKIVKINFQIRVVKIIFLYELNHPTGLRGNVPSSVWEIFDKSAVVLKNNS